MPIVTINQYLLPDGRVKRIQIDMEDEIAKKVEEIQSHEFEIAAEVLNTGEVSMTVSCSILGEDLEIEICPNGPPVPIAFKRLIEKFNLNKHLKRREEIQDEDQ